MQVQTDFSHPMKLNCSSIASSTPGNNASFPDGEIIKFEEFNNQSEQKNHVNIGHKKRLTIQINDSYDFNQSALTPSQLAVGVQSSSTEKDQANINFFKKHQKNHEGSNYGIGQSQSPSFAISNSEIQVHKILAYNSFLEQKLKDLQNENNQLRSSLNFQKSQTKAVKIENQSLKNTLKKKQQMIFHQKERNNKLNEKIVQHEQQKAEHVFYDQKLRQKQIRIQQLQRKLQKITTMNKAFQKQLKQSDKKIMQLEKDLQKTFCQNQQQTISRIKQSSVKVKQAQIKSKQLIANKQNQNNNVIKSNMGNTLGNTIQLRKSIDKKKCTQSQGKKKLPLKTTTQSNLKCQRASSSSNIVAKKLLVLKKQ